MTLPLRERHRQQTVRDIHQATLRLARDKGLDGITAEAIATEAGISTRTFFNYFPNKEAAAIGAPPGFAPEDLESLRNGTAPLADELKQCLDRHIAVLESDAETLRMVRTLVRGNAKARGALGPRPCRRAR